MLAPFLVFGCNRQASPPPAADSRPVVAVSIAPLGYLVDRLAGDTVRLLVMIPAGASPATHEPTMTQMQLLAKAVIYVKVGHPAFTFEQSWLGRLLAHNHRMAVVDAAHSATQNVDDPHLWTSPQVMRGVAQDIAAILQRTLPNASDSIERQLQELLIEIDALDRQIRIILAEDVGKTFYVFHPAWGWFAENYGLQQVAIERHGEHGAEPSPEELAQIIDRARADHATAIFVQPQFSSRSARMIADDIGAQVVVMDPLAADWIDNLRRVAVTLREAWIP
jgi:zinc transport system substrate-binding protein